MSLKLRPGVLMAETEYGMALLDDSSGDYWTLNPTAAMVLETLLAGRSAQQAVHALTERYDVSDGIAREDVERVLGELRSAGLVRED
ncbi:lasso peptide biosynthesis PqqD family chaperone [Streptomyces sp. B1866]|uniref:lasso peptide biosynthesis PqqD family chaperone n=1 Tax=Streptomyces sp. B1866 TaxID=3075431 RepID=UPI00289164E1|nr:lasso peptide biosynthesis PqqD family chaperone [Streptomyces sp. B1866]MDT3400053.1 lasso peptide biosynthesis PqqD family chaperone [Streptomyces sp. B1866]